MADEPRPPTAYKLIVGRSAILKMADRPTVDLYAGPPSPCDLIRHLPNRLCLELFRTSESEISVLLKTVIAPLNFGVCFLHFSRAALVLCTFSPFLSSFPSFLSPLPPFLLPLFPPSFFFLLFPPSPVCFTPTLAQVDRLRILERGVLGSSSLCGGSFVAVFIFFFFKWGLRKIRSLSTEWRKESLIQINLSLKERLTQIKLFLKERTIPR